MQDHTKREMYSWIKSIVFAFILVFICRQFLFLPTTVMGASMSPTFQDQDRIIVSRTSDIERFDMIVFDAPDSDEYYIKRVIGLPGDSIEMEDDVLYVNGKVYEEPYLEENKAQSLQTKLTYDFTLKELTGTTIVPPNSFFVMGDNRAKSSDSREFGYITEDSVIGEVKFRFYPVTEIGIPK